MDQDASSSLSVLDVRMPFVCAPDGAVHFEKLMYSTEVLLPGQGDVILRVHAVTTNESLGEISYAFGNGPWRAVSVDVCDSFLPLLFYHCWLLKIMFSVLNTTHVFPFSFGVNISFH